MKRPELFKSHKSQVKSKFGLFFFKSLNPGFKILNLLNSIVKTFMLKLLENSDICLIYIVKTGYKKF
ncbi:hypothetical protein BpHYR1_020472 [Brachionus plicatilis]|uniref:Uncharacterized protein n=1 Tax=Brachionus plicatilis TaxID=10195 RepID=A0A3M7Q2I1_BRAPC|nr:hypothetical protein BpHYR1_020472 [Brachionus plicatilis]